MSQNGYNSPPRRCPYCGERTKKLPTHVVKCDSVPPTAGFEADQ